MNQTSAFILPVAYLPPISYFVCIKKAESVCIEQHETYPKQTFRNRCEIYTEKGKTPLVIPVSKPNGNQTMTSDIRIFNKDPWYLKHWRAIETAYRSSPYFLYYKDDLKVFYNGSHNSLLEFDLALIWYFCELFEIITSINLSKNYNKNPDITDYRERLSPKKPPIIDWFPKYTQVFDTKHGFIPDLSIVDLLFNLGPESGDYILKLSEEFN